MQQEEPKERPPEQRWIEDGLCVGEWFVEPQRNRITRRGPAEEEHVRLEPKVMQVLVCMARRPGKTVTKEAFMEEVWVGTVVSNDALLRCVSELRSALGDDARDPEYVETIRTVGYRLIAPVRYEGPASDEAQAAENEASENEAVENGTPATSGGGDGAAPEPALPPSEAPPSEAPPSRSAPPDAAQGEPRSGAPAADRETRDQTPPPLLRRLAQQMNARRWGILATVLVLVFGAVALQAWWTSSAPTPSEAVPFTSFPGEEFDPALSPDGERVAFVWNGGETPGDSDDAAGSSSSSAAGTRRFDIYVKQRGTDEPLRITETPAREHSPAWSPEGNRLAFLRTSDEGAEIVIAPVIGGGGRTVAQFEERQVKELAWSPDGETLALSVQRRAYGAFRLVLLTTSGRRKRVLTQPPGHYRGDVDLAFSPDGRTLAFSRAMVDRVQDLYTVPVDGGTPERLTHDRAAISGLDWAADGQSVIFASNRQGTSRLWRIPASGGQPTWIATSTGGGLHQPSVARTGARMTLTERSLDLNVWRLHPVAGYDRLTSHRLLSSTRWDSYPDISPSSQQQLAFVSKRSGSFEVWTSRRDGTEPAQLTNFEGPFISAPRWSPDGEQIVFAVQGDGGADVYAIDATGGTPRALTHTQASDAAPRFSRDGRWVYFASNRSGRWQVWRKPADGGAAHQITRNGGFAAQEGPSGTYLYYVKKGRPGLWRRPLLRDSLGRSDTLGSGLARRDAANGSDTAAPPRSASSDTGRLDTLGNEGLLESVIETHSLEYSGEERVTAAIEPFDWGNWAATERGLYFVSRNGRAPALMYQSYDNDAPVRMAYLDGLPRHPSLAVAPGARWFLHTKVERNESDILLVERFQ